MKFLEVVGLTAVTSHYFYHWWQKYCFDQHFCLLFVCLFVSKITQKLWVDCFEIWRTGWLWNREESVKFLSYGKGLLFGPVVQWNYRVSHILA